MHLIDVYITAELLVERLAGRQVCTLALDVKNEIDAYDI